MVEVRRSKGPTKKTVRESVSEESSSGSETVDDIEHVPLYLKKKPEQDRSTRYLALTLTGPDQPLHNVQSNKILA